MRGASVEWGNEMRALFSRGKRSEEILDLTAPAGEGDGFVARWLRESLSLNTPEPAFVLNRHQEPAA
jgi:hypothetical protein